MTHSPFNRRQFLSGLSAGAGALWLGAPGELVKQAVLDAQRLQPSDKWRVLSEAQAAALDAMTAQIFPTTETPGAREAGVVRFIDQALATFAAADLPLVRQGVIELNREAHRRDPRVTVYAKLDQVRQADILRSLDDAKSEFFEAVLFATMAGMFADPSYGGNTGKVGWKLLGFDDRFIWQPPFGSYE